MASNSNLMPDSSRGPVDILPDDDNKTGATFVLHKEDHTLGNAVRYMCMKDKKIAFCGYSNPHPTEEKINVRVQTNDDAYTPTDALRSSLGNLKDASEHMLAVFNEAVSEAEVKK